MGRKEFSKREYEKHVKSLTHFIPPKGVLKKRKGYDFPETTIHTKECLGFWRGSSTMFYEQYGTWFLKVGDK